jgi:rod shape-determining protein MreC
MESLLGRYKNLIVLVVVLFAQVLGLAVQVKRTTDTDSSRLIRVWAVGTITPLERTLGWVQTGAGGMWHNYFYLRGVRAENRDLKQQIEQLRLEQVRLKEDAEQARRLQALLGFKEQFISQTVPAQVIGTGGSEQSRVFFIDKGDGDGIKPDMAVITVDGIVGKVLKVFRSTAQVLLINDQSSGVGAILEKSRLQGIVRGTPAGEVVLERIMTDETVQPGEAVRTSGGDRIFPKGLPVGVVTRVSNGPDLFLNIHVRPAANLSKLEEVLVVTKLEEKEPAPSETAPVRAADILAQRLPSVPDKPAAEDANKPKEGVAATSPTTAPKTAQANVPANGAPAAVEKSQAISAPAKVAGASPPAKPAASNSAPSKSSARAPGPLKPAAEQGSAPPTVKVAQKVPAGSKPKPPSPPAVPPPAKPEDGPQ